MSWAMRSASQAKIFWLEGTRRLGLLQADKISGRIVARRREVEVRSGQEAHILVGSEVHHYTMYVYLSPRASCMCWSSCGSLSGCRRWAASLGVTNSGPRSSSSRAMNCRCPHSRSRCFSEYFRIWRTSRIAPSSPERRKVVVSLLEEKTRGCCRCLGWKKVNRNPEHDWELVAVGL